jgi:glycosyltransferase involved in cell wall biosynthesis
VATAVGGNTELIEQDFNGSLVPARDPEALALALLPLLDSSNERKRMGENGRLRSSQRFDWDRCVAQYLNIYDELLQLPAANHISSVG